MRKMKLDKHAAEELACLCAVIINLSGELQSMYPISDEIVNSEILEAFIEEDGNLEP